MPVESPEEGIIKSFMADQQEKRQLTDFHALPPLMQVNVMAMVVAYLLRERGEETTLREGYKKQAQRWHHSMHVERGNEDAEKFEECPNEQCRNAVIILNTARQQDVIVPGIATQLLAQKLLDIHPLPDKGVRARLIEKDEPRLVRLS